MPDNSYGEKSGTSMAVGFVSGEAALLIVKFGEVGLKDRIIYSADKYSILIGVVHKGNKANLENAIESINNSQIIEIIGQINTSYNPAYPDAQGLSLYADSITALSITNSGSPTINNKFKVYANNVISTIGTTITSLKFPTWTNSNGQDDIIWYEGKYIGNNNWQIEVNTENHKNYETGFYSSHVYAYDNLGNAILIGSICTQVNKAITLSTISSTGTPCTYSKYKIYANNVVSAGSGVKTIMFPTWTSANGQDDIRWYEGKCLGNNNWEVEINTENHSYENGNYITNIYGYDNDGNITPLGEIFVYLNMEQFVASSITNTGLTKNSTFDLYANNVVSRSAASVAHVRFAVWTNANGQDDIIWYDADKLLNSNDWKKTIDITMHNNEEGIYLIHTYGFDNVENPTFLGTTSVIVDKQAPVGGTITNSESPTQNLKFKVYVSNVVDIGGSGIKIVKFPTWTALNGQDDIIWYDGKYISNNTWEAEINTLEHKNENGNYITHVYAYDNAGNFSSLGEVYTIVDRPMSTYQYDSNNRLIQILKNGQVILNFQYDQNGNLIRKY